MTALGAVCARACGCVCVCVGVCGCGREWGGGLPPMTPGKAPKFAPTFGSPELDLRSAGECAVCVDERV